VMARHPRRGGCGGHIDRGVRAGVQLDTRTEIRLLLICATVDCVSLLSLESGLP
jgi:hypothetical protein